MTIENQFFACAAEQNKGLPPEGLMPAFLRTFILLAAQNSGKSCLRIRIDNRLAAYNRAMASGHGQGPWPKTMAYGHASLPWSRPWPEQPRTAVPRHQWRSLFSSIMSRSRYILRAQGFFLQSQLTV